MYLLYVHYSGYCLFKVKEFEEIGHLIQSVRTSLNDIKKFSGIIKLKAFYAFQGVNEAQQNITDISQNKIPSTMAKFIEKFNFKQNQKLGFEFLNLSDQFKQLFGLNIINDVGVFEIIRSIKYHISKILKNHRDNVHEKMFLKSLCHKIVEKNSKVPPGGINITNSYNVILDFEKNYSTKMTNLKALIRPFYPELVRQSENCDMELPQFLSLYFQENKDDNTMKSINDLLGFERAKQYISSMENSIGNEVCDDNKKFIKSISDDFLLFQNDIKKFREISARLTTKVAPNLSKLLELSSPSDGVHESGLSASKLIAKAGSLKKLSGLASTTIHTLTFKDAQLRKGDFNKLSRNEADKVRSKQACLLSNKCALAARVDYFLENKSDDTFGQELHKHLKLDLRSWGNKKGITICHDDKEAVKDKIKKFKLKRKLKKKQWLQRKKERQMTENALDINMET